MSPTVIPVAEKTLSELQRNQRSTTVPFSIALPDGSALICTDMLRLLPGKRMVMRAEHQGNTVLAKLFFDAKHLQKEREGYALLYKTGVATPTLLTDYRSEQGGICLYQFIDSAIALDTLWQQSGTAKKSVLLEKLLSALQLCYQHQVLQKDLHLGNFLWCDDKLWVLDPASCSAFNSRTLNRATAQQDNLALLLAQLPFADWQPALEQIHDAFPAIRDIDLTRLARQSWQQRQQHYLQKIFRECSDVADLSAGSLRILCRRTLLTDTLAARLRDPASLITGATVLKNGNSAKVFLTEIAGKPLVVKQYINKDWLRKIRRAFRPSRAARSWHFSHAFSFAGITVPAPVALIEQKNGLLVTSAWYICEYSSGKDLLTCWQEREPTVEELSCLHSLFLSLQIIRSSHGDMKASNLLSDGARIALIDYDGAREHRRPSSLARALAADKQRFLQNWAGNTALQINLAELLDV